MNLVKNNVLSVPEVGYSTEDLLLLWFLWSPYGIGQAIIFLSSGFFLLLLSFYLFFLA